MAGPVTAGCVILSDDFPGELLNDSKKLSEKKRFELEPLIKSKALAWGVASVDHTVIDKINILQASMLAMQKAFANMIGGSMRFKSEEGVGTTFYLTLPVCVK